MEALISVIVPVYNVEKYLKGCLNSIVEQTYKNLEIILVDDGSTDESGNICDMYAAKDKRIKVIHSQNGGVSSARNKGIDAAKGDYIGFVDSDDYITDDMYEYMLGLALKYNVGIVQCGRTYTSRVYEDRKLLKQEKEKLRLVEKENALHELLCSKSVRSSLCYKLYKKELFENVRMDTTLVNGEDGIANYHLINQTDKILLSNKICYFYYNREGSCTKGLVNEKIYNNIGQIKAYAKVEKNKRLKKSWDFNIALKSMNYLYRAISQNEFEHFEELRANVVSAKSILLNPFKYRVKNAKLFHFYFILIWLSPNLYKRIIRLRKRVAK